MRIALISCTSKKKAYKCLARDLYSESPRFRLAYDLAKLVADKIFILSAKYGLVPEDMVIEPYNETLKDKSTQERRAWGDMLQEAKLRGEDFIDLVSGDIHKQMGMKNRMPQVCNVMYKIMMPGDEVLHTTPSGKSSTIKIRYDLRKR
jgi:cytoplasmic iron level regulating protein YaaA (DUF328/UPF0246 family)